MIQKGDIFIKIVDDKVTALKMVEAETVKCLRCGAVFLKGVKICSRCGFNFSE